MPSKIVLGGAIALLIGSLAVVWHTSRPGLADGSQAEAPPAPASVAPGPEQGAALAYSEEALRRTLAERIPMLASIDQIRPTPVAGLYEVQVGTDVLYVDAAGDHLFQGQLFDTRARRNLTQERVDELTAVDFDALPLQDAIVMVNGEGQRRIAVFGDPNCGYCKRFERDLAQVDNLTVYTFLYPILSPDSHEKSRNIWCAKDALQAWRAWMLEGQVPVHAECTTPVERNVELGRKLRVTGTPTIVFENGTRIPGALSAQQLELELQNHARR